MIGAWQKVRRGFSRASEAASEWIGSPPALMLALGFLVGWLLLGPFMGYSELWHLILNSPTTSLTFLLLFLLQASTKNGEKAIQAKLDELIRSNEKARNELIGAEKQCE
jgi:low affinity Fe/Cu permease